MDHFFIPNETECGIIEEIADSDSDCSVVMINLYTSWMEVLDVLIKKAGGKKLWQLPVMGQSIGNQDLDEIIAVW